MLFGTTAFQQAGQLVSQGPAVVERVAAQLNETFGLTIDPATITSSLQLEATDVQKFAEDLGGGVIGVFGSLASVLFDLITVIVFSFYIAGAGPGLVQRLAVWMPHERQLVLGELWQIATEKTGGYVASKVVLSAISSFFYGVFFYFVDLPGWLPLALLVGLTAQFIPLVGTYIGIAVPIVVALAAKPITALWILIFSVDLPADRDVCVHPARIATDDGREPRGCPGCRLPRGGDLGTDRRDHRCPDRRCGRRAPGRLRSRAPARPGDPGNR